MGCNLDISSIKVYGLCMGFGLPVPRVLKRLHVASIMKSDRRSEVKSKEITMLDSSLFTASVELLVVARPEIRSPSIN